MGNADAMSRRGKTGDDYKTPSMCIQALINNTNISKSALILDPCCGDNKVIGRVLRENGYKNIMEYDILNGTDFHRNDSMYDYIIMNSPYSDKTRFLLKSFTVAKNVLSILPQNVTNYNEFQALFMDMPYYRGQFLMRPKFFMTSEEREIPKRGGVSAYSWFYWKTVVDETAEPFVKNINLEPYFKGEEHE